MKKSRNYVDYKLKKRVNTELNIVDVVGLEMDLEKKGGGFVGSCYSHNDTEPSFTVTPGRNIEH